MAIGIHLVCLYCVSFEGMLSVNLIGTLRRCLVVLLSVAMWLVCCMVFGWSAVWQFGCSATVLLGWSAAWVVGWLATWPFGQSAVWLFGWLAVGYQIFRLVCYVTVFKEYCVEQQTHTAHRP